MLIMMLMAIMMMIGVIGIIYSAKTSDENIAGVSLGTITVGAIVSFICGMCLIFSYTSAVVTAESIQQVQEDKLTYIAQRNDAYAKIESIAMQYVNIESDTLKNITGSPNREAKMIAVVGIKMGSNQLISQCIKTYNNRTNAIFECDRKINQHNQTLRSARRNVLDLWFFTPKVITTEGQ